MSAVRNKNSFILSDFADGSFHGERAIAALRGTNVGVVGKVKADGSEPTVTTVDAALIIELLKSGKDEDLRAVGDLLANAKKLPQGSLQELLRLMMLRGVGSFEQDWLDLIPDGIYTLDGRKQVEWVARTIHMLLLIQQQQQTFFPGMAMPVAVNQSFQRIAQMESQMYQVLRHSEPAQVQAGMRALVADPHNRSAIITVRDFIRQNPALIDAVAYQKMAITVATPWLRDLAQASQQFQAVGAELARSGKLNPAAQSALALTQPALAQMVLMAREIPGIAPANLSPASLQMLAGLQRVDSILLAAQQTPLSPSMQRAIENLSLQINAALISPLREGVVLRTDNPIILNLNMVARNDLLATPLLDPNGRRVDTVAAALRPLDGTARMPDVIARTDTNGLTPVPRENMSARAMVNDPWANVIPLPVVRAAEAVSIAPATASVLLSYQNPIATIGRAANDDRPVAAAVYQPPVVAISGDTRGQQEPEPRRVVLAGAGAQVDNSSTARNPILANGSAVRGGDVGANTGDARGGGTGFSGLGRNDNTESGAVPTAAPAQAQRSVIMGAVDAGNSGAIPADGITAKSVEAARAGQSNKSAAEAYAPPQPVTSSRPVDSGPADQPPAAPVAVQDKKTEYKPSEKIGEAASRPTEPGAHVCGPGCMCGKIVGEKLVAADRRPPKLDLDAVVAQSSEVSSNAKFVDLDQKASYKPSEKIGEAALKPKEPGEHICGPNCSCGKVIGEKVVSTTRRPPKLDLTTTVATTEPKAPSKCEGCNGEKGCCPGKGKPLSSNGGAHIPTQNAEPSLNAAATGTGVVEFKNNSSPGRVYDFINASTKGRHAA